jgi:S-disulfanyl-L-cysteine oxidoreductase SoxD
VSPSRVRISAPVLARVGLAIGLGFVHGSLTHTAVPQQARTTWSGIYTDGQAKRGQAVYEQQCSSCHLPDLTGADQAPGLVGPDFNNQWNDMSIHDLFERTRISMPADKPGTMKPEQVADVLAFMLSKGGFPAGDAELPAQPDALRSIKFLAVRP